MTVVVAFYCDDGIVVAADSMITPSMGGMFVGHHHGIKVDVLSGNQIFAFSGDQGQAARFKIVADASHENISTNPFAINYPLSLSSAMVQSFGSTGIAADKIGVNTVVAYPYNNTHQCCVFEGAIQPRLLDANHYYVALGSGKTSADPFLRFLDDIFCQRVQPKVKDALFLSVWTIQHVIDTTFGLVDGPIRVVVMERNGTGALEARLLSPSETGEHVQAIEAASAALRNWRVGLESGAAAGGATPLPTPPAAP
jgi:20S proteasome alpha/beta subunit